MSDQEGSGHRLWRELLDFEERYNTAKPSYRPTTYTAFGRSYGGCRSGFESTSGARKRLKVSAVRTRRSNPAPKLVITVERLPPRTRGGALRLVGFSVTPDHQSGRQIGRKAAT